MDINQLPTPANQRLPELQNLVKFILFPAVIVAGFILSNAVATYIDSIQSESSYPGLLLVFKWLVLILIAIINITFLAGMGVLAHDGVHRTLFKNKVINDIASSLLSIHALIPFYANRQFHLSHHQYAHQRGRDPEEVIHNRPYWSAMLLGPFFALVAQYQILFKNLAGKTSKKRYHSVADLIALVFALSNYLYWLPRTGLELKYTYIPMLLVLPIGYNFRAISDHYGLQEVMRKRETDINKVDNKTLQQENSGWVVLTNPVLQWIWSNVNYHEVHHKFPYLSYRYLPIIYELTKQDFEYRVVKGYTRSLLALRHKIYYQSKDIS